MTFPSDFINRLKNTRNLCVLTGAGISKESGVPTFRDLDGHWANYNPHELATPEAFMANPKLVWGWYNERRKQIEKVSPNSGHEVLAKWENQFENFHLNTQNVDSLHRRAGSKKVAELHGNIEASRCFDCGKAMHVPPFEGFPPKCPCGGLPRPGVVWFGEGLPMETLKVAQKSAMNCEVFLSIGTSSLVFPAADLPLLALNGGAYVVEINPEPTDMSDQFHLQISGPSGVILPAMDKLIFN